ncbi:hypothetical protein [Stenotrophomonas maltophilia]|uniref:hypothetical protein n=1 Tax=Stenotrophomonas maltophilia TaxID=40324 RepID=UPI00209A8EBC|nr:hypothetical protein [Stenotrophomonas maltophilia]MCO7494742.1 hypothetical protein [Stenotrophomonas maltophilia]
MSRAVDVLAVLAEQIASSRNALPILPEHLRSKAEEAIKEVEQVHARVSAVFDAARAVLSVTDFPDLLHAEERLREALDACEPTDTDHNREAVDGLCVEENDDEQ